MYKPNACFSLRNLPEIQNPYICRVEKKSFFSCRKTPMLQSNDAVVILQISMVFFQWNVLKKIFKIQFFISYNILNFLLQKWILRKKKKNPEKPTYILCSMTFPLAVHSSIGKRKKKKLLQIEKPNKRIIA